ncbi:MAG: hypothetical protein ACTH2K_08645 [Candidatus Corynebacterium faecigallinarum]
MVWSSVSDSSSAQAARLKAIGYQGIHSSLPRIIDHDVSKQVKNHGRYYRDTTLQA